MQTAGLQGAQGCNVAQLKPVALSNQIKRFDSPTGLLTIFGKFEAIFRHFAKALLNVSEGIPGCHGTLVVKGCSKQPPAEGLLSLSAIYNHSPDYLDTAGFWLGD